MSDFKIPGSWLHASGGRIEGQELNAWFASKGVTVRKRDRRHDYWIISVAETLATAVGDQIEADLKLALEAKVSWRV